MWKLHSKFNWQPKVVGIKLKSLRVSQGFHCSSRQRQLHTLNTLLCGWLVANTPSRLLDITLEGLVTPGTKTSVANLATVANSGDFPTRHSDCFFVNGLETLENNVSICFQRMKARIVPPQCFFLS